MAMMDHGHGHKHDHGHGMGGNEAATATPSNGASRGQSKGYALIAFVYLFGLVMGALDMSIVNPARTVIQNAMSVDDSLGVWILTIYTLAYAASIPVMGKLADRHGRKNIYLLCILLFGVGSLLCGLSRTVGSFEMLIGARVIQALGGGGIMPVATAEFGTAFPEEKRGMALGMVGMVYGLSSIFGPSIGSGILEAFGATEWQFIFFVNVPICIVVLVLGLMKLPNSKADEVKPIDGLGILILTVMTLSLMYGLKNIDFFDLASSITTTDVYPFLLGFAILLPFFILREKKAADPVINLSYFTNINIVIALICSIISGIVMMGTIFFPQFCENAMMMKSGSGGYFIALLGVGSAVGSMGSGSLIDKFGVKPVLGLGFIGSALGSLFMAFVACNNPNMVTVCATMLLSGLGLGFIMGTPLNYMMLQNTTDEESNSALATLSLVRSIGTAVAPAIMVAFIVHASSFMQDELMESMPKEVNVSPLPYAAQIDQKLDEMRADEDTAEMLEGLDIPKLSDYQVVEVNMNNTESDFDVEVSDETIEQMQNSDVTTIVDTCKDMTTEMFGQIKPQLIEDAQSGLQAGLSSMREKSQEMQDALTEMDDGISEMNSGLQELSNGISEMNGNIGEAANKIDELSDQMGQMRSAIDGINAGISAMRDKTAEMKEAIPAMQAPIDAMTAQIEGMEDGPEKDAAVAQRDAMQAQVDQTNAGIAGMEASIAENEAKKAQMQEAIDGMSAARDGISAGKSGMEEGRAEMQSARNEMISGRTELTDARSQLGEAYDSLNETINQLEQVNDAIPGLFDEAEQNYLTAIDENAEEIQKTYQATLNAGFKDMALFVAACAFIGALVLIPYREIKPAGGAPRSGHSHGHGHGHGHGRRKPQEAGEGQDAAVNQAPPDPSPSVEENVTAPA